MSFCRSCCHIAIGRIGWQLGIKVKNFIDTAVVRGGDAVSGWLFEGLRMLDANLSAISFVAVPIAVLWASTAYLLGQRQEQLRASLKAKRIYPQDETQS